jgi:hypothetical protein
MEPTTVKHVLTLINVTYRGHPMVRLGHHFANTRRLQQTLHQPRPASIRVMASPSRQLVLSDAHAHPQEDTQHLGLVQSLQAREVAVMGVSAVTDDWDKVGAWVGGCMGDRLL